MMAQVIIQAFDIPFVHTEAAGLVNDGVIRAMQAILTLLYLFH